MESIEYKCKFCDKFYTNPSAYKSHEPRCSKNPNRISLDYMKTKEYKEKIRSTRIHRTIEQKEISLMKRYGPLIEKEVICGNPNCGKICFYKEREKIKKPNNYRFCSRSCANSRQHSEKDKKHLSTKAFEFYNSVEMKLLKLENHVNKHLTESFKYCPSCFCFLSPYHLNKYCSKICVEKISSKENSKRILNNPKSFWTYLGDIEFSDALTMRFDSKLEVVGLIYLFNKYDIETVNRFDTILSFIDKNGIERTTFPDFVIETKDKKKYIVEVKNSKNKIEGYTDHLKEKQVCYQEHANNNNMEFIWLDANENLELLKLYKRFLGKLSKQKVITKELIGEFLIIK